MPIKRGPGSQIVTGTLVPDEGFPHELYRVPGDFIRVTDTWYPQTSKDVGLIDVSVGRRDPRDDIYTSVPSIPTVDQRPTYIPPPPPLKPAVRPHLTTNSELIWDTPVQYPTRPSYPVSTQIPKTPSSGGKPVALDLGNVFGIDIASIIEQRFMRRGTQDAPTFTQGLVTELANNLVDIPLVDVVSQNPGTGFIYDPMANCGKGKWIKKRRRRRNRLATPSDIKDLASLKQVTGASNASGNDVFKTWIATRRG